MEEVPRQQLCALMAQYGRSLVEEPGRCEALLRDVCGAYRREIFVLVSVLKDGVATALCTASASVPPAVLVARLTQRVQEHLGLSAETAGWAVESWALALGRLSPQEVAQGAGARDGSEAQDTPSPTPVTPPLPTPSPAPAAGAQTTVPPASVPMRQRQRKWPALLGIAVITAVIAAIAAGIGHDQHERTAQEARQTEAKRIQEEREAEARRRQREEARQREETRGRSREDWARAPQNPPEDSSENESLRMDGRWRLRWQPVDGALHDSTLDMQGTSGTLLTTYQHPFRGRQHVRQTMQLKSLPVGAVLAGSNPIDRQTRRPVGDYAPDNFLLIPQPDGVTQVVLCDALALRSQNPALCVPVAVTPE